MELLRHLVTVTKLHPILVNFTAALIPFSVLCDFFANYFKKSSFRDTAWWTLCFGVFITPFTAMAGWLFWMKDDNGVAGMTIHKWLGTSLAIIVFGLFFWRRKFHRSQKAVNMLYLAVAVVFVALLVYQGHLGGTQVFSDM